MARRVSATFALVGLARINRSALCTYAAVPNIAYAVMVTRTSVIAQRVLVAAAMVGSSHAVVDRKA
jgi:hypothetical protein